jgi:hypothetical protein
MIILRNPRHSWRGGFNMMVIPIYPINGIGGITLFISAIWWMILKFMGD